MKQRTKVLFALGSAGILVLVFVGGLYLGYKHRPSGGIAAVQNGATPPGTGADFAPFWEVWSTIDQKFPDAKNVSAQDRVYGAIKGLVGSLGDPYSVYFPPQASKDFQDTINGSFEGIGLEVGVKDGMLTAIAPLKNSPAEKAGIKAGDMIVKIDGVSTTDMSVDQAVHAIRGPKDTSVKLTVFRKGDSATQDISVSRDTIDIPLISSKDLGGGVYSIALYSFGTDSDTLFAKEIQKFKASGDTKLIIDLRNNPGGYLSSAVNIASMFLPQGDLIVTENYGGSKADDVFRSKGTGEVNTSKVKVVILVDGGSASASEILAGALQENGAATLIGQKTYGKGSVQEVMNVTDDTTLKLTIAKWLTPNGTWISKKGIEPDISVTATTDDVKAGKDPMQDRALQFFTNGK